MPYLLVGAGGFLGANARFIINKVFIHIWGLNFPYGTFFINVSGSFLLGLIWDIAIYSKAVPPEYLKYFFGVGFLGAYTTFSTFEFETSALLKDGNFFLAASYVIFSIILGLAAVRLGLMAGKYFVQIT
jgi:CrcB protein